MVFPGHFSTGCARCRRRKVKCDERKPTCRRCYIYGKPCPGYSDQFQFRYRGNSTQKTAVAATASSAGQANASSSTADPVGQSSSDPPRTKTTQKRKNSAAASAAAPASQVSIPVALAPASLEHMSLCYYIRRFTSPTCADAFPGHLTFLPGLLDQDHPGLLELATTSVAQMAAYNRYGGPKLLQSAYTNYGRALSQLRTRVDSNTLDTDDKTTSAVMMLCNFIDMTGEHAGYPASHTAGVFYLIDSRGPEQLATTGGFELFVMALVRMQTYSMLHNDDSYADPCGLSEALSNLHPLMEAMYIVSRILKLRHSLLNINAPSQSHNPLLEREDAPPRPLPRRQRDDGPIDEQSLLKQVFTTLEQFDRWDQKAPTWWKTTFEGRTAPTPLGQAVAGQSHYDKETAYTMILLRSSRLVLIDALLEYQKRKTQIEPESETTIRFAEHAPYLEGALRCTIGDMLLCVPYALGDLDAEGRATSIEYDGAMGMVIMHPVRLISYCPYSTPEQREAANRTLHRINSTMGVRMATPWVGPSMDIFLTAPSSPATTVGQASMDSGIDMSYE